LIRLFYQNDIDDDDEDDDDNDVNKNVIELFNNENKNNKWRVIKNDLRLLL
jgi:hypothetical protein